ncbi:MAG: SufS family cysteine desulfurase [Acidimicrobiales bacterium]
MARSHRGDDHVVAGAQLPGSGSGPYFLGASGGTSSLLGNAGGGHDLRRARDDFPALRQKINGRRLVWLDSGATTQKPQVVIDRVRDFYQADNSNVHRAAHTLAARATEIYEGARATVARFLGAGDASEIVFTRSATEALNLVAHSAGARFVGEGDEIVLSELEHHSNIVPWQLLAERTGARVKVLPIDDAGDVRLDELPSVLGPRTRVLAVTAASNALGTVVPLEPLITAAHACGALVVVDGAQAVAHLPLDVTALDVDFFVFSGHKIFGPTGIGALYGKRRLLEEMPPWQGGGSMIDTVTFERSTYAPVPAKFEAGTGHIAGAAGLATALDYVDAIGRAAIMEHELELVGYLVRRLGELPRLDIVGHPRVRGSAVSFVADGMAPEEVARHLDQDGIAVRAGHHCAQPVLRRFGLTSTVRPSVALYNTTDDVDELVASLCRLLTPTRLSSRVRSQQLPPRDAPRSGLPQPAGSDEWTGIRTRMIV